MNRFSFIAGAIITYAIQTRERGRGTKMITNQKRCARCISDTSILDIRFDANGVCNYCNIHDKMAEQFPLTGLGLQKFKLLIEKIKRKGKAKSVHFDNGWDSEIAITNMKNAVTKLDIDLKTVTCDWVEYKALQLKFDCAIIVQLLCNSTAGGGMLVETGNAYT